MHWLYLQLSCRNVRAGGQSTSEHRAETMVCTILAAHTQQRYLKLSKYREVTGATGHTKSPSHLSKAKADRDTPVCCVEGMTQEHCTVNLGVLPMDSESV